MVVDVGGERGGVGSQVVTHFVRLVIVFAYGCSASTFSVLLPPDPFAKVRVCSFRTRGRCHFVRGWRPC